jgi:DNA-binding CsgD family transcriptional regulator
MTSSTAAFSRSDFVGRNAELDTLRDCIRRATVGSGQIVLVEGEAGIGKSRLLAEALDDAELMGMHVFRAAGEELERRRPFGVVTECLSVQAGASDPRRAQIAGMLHSSPGDPALFEGLEFRVSEALLQLVDDLAVARPIVLALDDLQWADPASLSILHRLGLRIGELPALLVVAFRPVPRPIELDQLIRSLRSRGGVDVSLGALSDDEVAELVAQLAGGEPGPNLRTQAAAAGGNPVFIRELIYSLEQAGAIRRNGIVEVETTALPHSLTLTILHRISFLSSSALELLRVAAVLGSRFSTTDLMLVTGRSVVESQADLREAIDAGVLGEAGDTLQFRHDLIREALYDDLPADIRSALHKEIGHTLADAGAPAGRVAEHLLRAATYGDQNAVMWLRKAADDAMGTAPAVAAELLERALELTTSDGDRGEMLAQRAQLLFWSGDNLEAERACREVLDLGGHPQLEGSLRISLLLSLTFQLRNADALVHADAGLAVETLTPTERARLRALGSQVRLFTGDIEGALDQARQSIAEAVDAHDIWAHCEGLQTQAFIANFRGEFARALAVQDEALRLAGTSRSKDVWQLPLHVGRGIFLVDLDRLVEAREAVRAGREINAEIGVRFSTHFHHYVDGMALAFAGEWDDALAEIQAGLAIADEFDFLFAAPTVRCYMGVIALHRDDLVEAENAVAESESVLARGPNFRMVWLLWARALLLEANGDVDAAAAMSSDAWALCAALGNTAEAGMIGPDLVRMTLAGGRREAAEAIAADALDLAHKNPGVATLEGAALRCRGLVEGSADVLVDAAVAYRAGPRVLDRAGSCEDAAAALADAGRKDEARILFDEALDMYERLSASRDIARVEARARAAGIRRGRRGARQRPKLGWDALTPTEQKVTDLVARGLTNREIAEAMFLSPHTVHTHVSHVLAKIGVPSRVALAAAHASRG